MKKSGKNSHVAEMEDTQHGEKYGRLLEYFFPEFITNLLIYSVPFFLDAAFIGALSSTETYAALSVANNVIHLVIKVAEAFSVGTIILSGIFNGRSEFQQAGRALVDSFWVTTIMGFFFSVLLYVGAPFIYTWYGATGPVLAIGVPFLKIRAVSVFCMFVYFALIGFMRGIKNTKTPMKIFAFGSLLFVFFDYAFIFGEFGFPMLHLQGSAVASCIQYIFMTVVGILYMLWNPKLRQYSIELFVPFQQITYVRHLAIISFPVLLDKSAMAISYVWLGKMIATIGMPAMAAFDVVKNMERFAFIPAIAFAQVITFLVSNDVGKRKWEAIRVNTKKVLVLSTGMVVALLVIFSIYSQQITQIFDRKGDFSGLAQQTFPLISVLVVFDLLQLILSGALRGSGNGYTVMVVRCVVCFFYFGPVSYALTQLNFSSDATRFIAIFGAFYFGNAIMSLVYIYWFRNGDWKQDAATADE